jgi:amino acid transporter
VVELAYHWRQVLSGAAGAFGFVLDPAFHVHGDINRLVACTAPVFWLFFLLTGCSLFVLRWREPHHERPFRVPLYPVLPLIFVLSCAFMLYKSTAYAIDQQPAEAIIVGGLVLLALPLGLWSARARLKCQQTDSRY